MNKTSVLWQRMTTAARDAAMRHGWRAAARIRRDWTEWHYCQMPQDNIDARLRALFRPSEQRR